MRHYLKISTCAIVAFFFVQTLASAALDSRALEALEEMKTASSDADLLKILPHFSELRGKSVLWRNAVVIAQSELGRKPPGRTAVVRLLRLALLLDSSTSDIPEWASTKESLERLTQNDLEALRRATNGFPDPNDAIIHLLNRKPTLRSQPGFGEYIVMVIKVAPDSTRRVIRERSSVEFMDLGPTWVEREYESDKVPAEELGQTRRFELKHLPDIVLAAKAFRIAELAPLPLRGYAAYVASEALAHGLQGFGFKAADGGTTGFLAWAVRQWALNQTAVSPDDEFLAELSQKLRIKMPLSAFDARAFPEAAEAYRKASKAEPERRLWAAWGEAISYFAAREYRKSAIAFERMTPLFTQAKNADNYAYLLIALLQNLPSNERGALGGLAAVRAAADKRLGTNKLTLDKAVFLDSDFARIMVSIGRSDLGLIHIAQRLDAVDAIPEARRDQVETRYLRELGAFSRDLCYDISWFMSSSAGWKVRPTSGYSLQLDFLHNMNNRKEAVVPGEVVSFSKGVPYGMISPEEDCVLVALHTVNLGRGGLRDFQASKKTSITSNIYKWAVSSKNRKSPDPSLAPFLKVVWAEWFFLQFDSLKEPDKSARDFIYYSPNTSGITDPKQLRALKKHPAATPGNRALIDLFLYIRELLERRYGDKK